MSQPGRRDSKSDPIPPWKIIRVIFQLFLVLTVLGGLLFVPAGRLDWVDAWAYLIAYGTFLLAYAAWGLLKNPEQLNERSGKRTAKNVKLWDRVILSLYTVLLLILFVVCGLDAGRFHWSFVPAPVKGLAWLGLTFSGALILLDSCHQYLPVTSGTHPK